MERYGAVVRNWLVYVAIAFVLALAALVAWSNVANSPLTDPKQDRIELLKHKKKCDDINKKKKKKRCKDDCGIGRYGEHPDNPRRCRNRWPK